MFLSLNQIFLNVTLFKLILYSFYALYILILYLIYTHFVPILYPFCTHFIPILYSFCTHFYSYYKILLPQWICSVLAKTTLWNILLPGRLHSPCLEQTYILIKDWRNLCFPSVHCQPCQVAIPYILFIKKVLLHLYGNLRNDNS